jgi:hypothetical protein
MHGLHNNRHLRGSWRRRLFAAWVLVSAAAGIYIALAGPVASYLGEGRDLVALVVPGLMVFFLATGLGWLVLLVTSRRSRRAQGR